MQSQNYWKTLLELVQQASDGRRGQRNDGGHLGYGHVHVLDDVFGGKNL